MELNVPEEEEEEGPRWDNLVKLLSLGAAASPYVTIGLALLNARNPSFQMWGFSGYVTNPAGLLAPGVTAYAPTASTPPTISCVRTAQTLVLKGSGFTPNGQLNVQIQQYLRNDPHQQVQKLTLTATANGTLNSTLTLTIDASNGVLVVVVDAASGFSSNTVQV
jgi:hypothetical protein